MTLYPLLVENVALPLSDLVTTSRFWSQAKELARQHSLGTAAMERLQRDQLQKLFDVAIRETHFWAERLPTNSVELTAITPVSKQEIERAFPDQIVNRSSDRTELRFSATNGTTQRMICVHDFAKRDSMRAAMIHTLRVAGYRVGMPVVEIPPNVCETVCGELGESDDGLLNHLAQSVRRGELRKASVWRDARGKIERDWIFRKRNYSPFDHRGSNQPDKVLDEYIESLANDRPHILKGLSTYLYQIAKRILSRNDVSLNIPVLRTSGSQVTPKMKATIEAAFGGSYFNDYGTAELGPVAAECEVRNGMHVFASQFIVEVVDQDLSPVSDGSLGEVLVTDLTNLAMPLIRYRVGDLGRTVHERCACGSSFPRLWIEGRVQDAITDVAGNWVSSEVIADRLYAVPWLDQFQLVEQNDRSLEMTVVLDRSRNAEVGKQQQHSELLAILHDLLGEHRDLRVLTSKSIASEPGGKFRWVKSFRANRVEANA